MDPGLLKLYNQELAHLREVGAEFAREFPKIASRLTMDGLEVADPYVERLLEGFAFMAARTQLKLDAEYPRFVQHLLETVYPNFLSPVPSMMVARLQPDLSDPALAKGYRLPRQSALTSQAVRGQNTRCEFRTAHDVTVWPIELAGVRLGVVHETGDARGRERRCQATYDDLDVLVFGHSHVPWDTTTESGLRLLNPGSPTDRRRQPHCTYMTCRVEDGRLDEVVLHRLPPRG